MQIKLGAKVYSSDDRMVGNVGHIVIYPGTKEITHLVIQKGQLFNTDRVINVESIHSADEKRVILRQAASELANTPEFVRGQYVPVAPAEQASAITAGIPQGTVALKEGARVITSNGQRVGNVERIYTAPGGDRATNLLISKGLLMKARKVIPTDLISSVLEEEVRLAVDSDFLNSLPENIPEMEQAG